MDKKDFDFDFEKEFGFDPKAFLDADGYDEDIDLSEFSDEELGLSPEKQPEEAPSANYDDLDLGDLDLGGFDGGDDLDLDAFLNSDEEEADEAPEADFDFSEKEDYAEDTDFLAETDYDDDPAFAGDSFGEEPDFFGHEDFGEEPDFPESMESEETEMNKNMDYTETPRTRGRAEYEFKDTPVFEEDDPEPETPVEPEPTPRPRRERKAPQKPKEAKPNILTKFFDLYFAPVLDKSALEQPVDPNNPRRRRKKSKAQIFKEVYLPPIIACVCLILIFSFVIGSISNAIEQKRADDAAKQSQIEASSSAAELVELEYQKIMDEAAALAAEYDYAGAVTKLDSFANINDYPDMLAKRSEYSTIQDSLVEHQDPTLIPNLSFHVLMADPARAIADEGLGGKYNRNFVTIGEFSKILQQLYDNGYVLVNFDSFTEVVQTVSGEDQFLPKPILLPEGKKPFMLTETLVSYYTYMIDSNNDGVADAGGDGFASKLVLDASGEIKAEYVDASGNTLVGNYDLVPILEDFIKAHPDFSYKGARATLAVTGDEGIFGYRCNTSYASNVSTDYYEKEKAGAITIVNALREKGYNLACYTYANGSYRDFTANQITADLQNWTSQITPIIGEIDTFVFAQMSDLTDYSGTAFKAMYQTGFRYFVSNGKEPLTEVKNTYVHQNRLMVTGEYMYWSSDRFAGMFDCNMVLDLPARGGSVPKD